ncbi:MAG: branched-chain amino acid ABC transporter substrate-binding protein [Dehalococcoidia bacterium]|nr:MAG: branched-chain amino acid ABC transporter substrate-binding protein [Dehalococcoidia bacterium]
MIRRVIRLGAVALLALVLVPTAAGQGDRESVIGVLVARQPTAAVSTAAVAAQIAERDLNDYFAQLGESLRIRVEVRETDQDPVRAAAALRELIALGARVVVGPQTSNELQAIRPIAQAAGVVLISYASTAPSLAVPGDGVFRLAPDDRLQAEAVVQLMREEGIEVVVPIWRGDVYGDDLVQAFRSAFPGPVAEGVRYSPAGADYPAVVAALAAQVQRAVDRFGAHRVGVYFVSLGEVTPLLRAASQATGLRAVSWYGSDGAVLELSLLADPAAAVFAWTTGFIAPVFGEFIANERTDLIADEIRSRSGMAPEPYTLTAYDSVMVAGLALRTAGRDIGRLPEVVAAVADGYFGVTGPVDLNEAGDRISGSYDFWAIDSFDGSLVWLRQATYEVVPGEAGHLDWLEVRRKPGEGFPLPPIPTGR